MKWQWKVGRFAGVVGDADGAGVGDSDRGRHRPRMAVVGLVTMENVTEFMMIREAVKERAMPLLRPPPLPARACA
jgi:hypothetical protein